jgi:2-(1,2-epoxy-1,2-dihydrophenyl)acetyl-CoA isomerase
VISPTSDNGDAGLRIDYQDEVVVMRLDRPHVLNAIDQRMRDSWIESLRSMRSREPAPRVMVLTGTGRAFCSGGDVSEQLDYMGPTAHDGFRGQYAYQEIVRLMHDLPIPIIGAVNGIAQGGGTAVALMTDLRVASSSAVFGVGQVMRGLVPDVGLTYLLPRIVGVTRALELMMTNEPISAQRALELGMVNWVVPAEEVMPKALEVAHRLAGYPAPALEWIKRVTYEGLDISWDAALRMEAAAQGILCNRIEFEESVNAFNKGDRSAGRPASHS